MLKYALLGATMAITAPALAQTTATTPAADAATAQTAPTTAPTDAAAPGTTAPMAQSAPTAQPAPTTGSAPMGAAPAAQTADAAPAAEPAAPAEQVASVVDKEFGTYDKDTNGNLSEAEFGTWMVALKSQTDPTTDANAAATKSWNKAAFAQADADKSKSVSKTELAGFLAPAKS